MRYIMLLRLWFDICCFAIYFKLVSAQDDFPLVTVPDTSVNADDSTTKAFNTQVLVIPINAILNPFQLQIFLDAANDYYAARTSLRGFFRIENMQSSPEGNGTVQVIYDVVYNFTQLRNSSETNPNLLNEIRTLAGVRRGIEANTNFSLLYTISDDQSTFGATGERLCEKVGCPQGRFTICTEVLNGVSTTCRSSCKSNFCLNGGMCSHSNGTVSPLCSCPTSSDVWYLGTFCELYVALWIPIVFFVVVFLLIIAILIAGFCLPVTLMKRKKSTIPSVTVQKSAPIRPSIERERDNENSVRRSSSSEVDRRSQRTPPRIPSRAYSPPVLSSDPEPGYSRVLTLRFGTASSNPTSTATSFPRDNQTHSAYSVQSTTPSSTSGEDMASCMLNNTISTQSVVQEVGGGDNRNIQSVIAV